MTTQSSENGAVDWHDIRSRIEDAQTFNVDKVKQDKRAILKARALDLAQEPQSQEIAEDHLDVVAFYLADEMYGLALAHIKEVFTHIDLTSVPCTPDYVAGIINVRGQIFSVLDSKAFFNLSKQGQVESNTIIIIQSNQMEFGLLVDAIAWVQAVSKHSLQASLPTLTGLLADYVKGITNEHLILLDAAKILADERLIVREEVRG